jgi:predicted nuclease with TOPRIM domain
MYGMVRVIHLCILLSLALLPLSVSADGFSSIVDNGRVKFSLHYPPEVRIGSCFTTTFQTTVLGSIDIVKLRLTITFVSEAGSQTILTDTIISSTTSFSPGDTINKVYSVCVPQRAVRDPVIVAALFSNYTRSSAAEPLTHNWLIAVARDRTYDEILRDLNEARDTINSLQSTINSLRAEISSLRERTDTLNRELARLETLLATSQDAYSRLKSDYDKLTVEYQALNEKYLRTLGDLQALQSRYDELSRENSALYDRYQQLLSDYNSLSSDFTSLKASYSQLQTIYSELRSRHDAATMQIGQLQQQLDDTRRSYDLLQLSYNSLSQENILNRNIAYAQAAGLVAVGSVAATAYLVRRRQRSYSEAGKTVTPPPPPPPPPTPEPGPAVPTVAEGGPRVQKILAGRRVTIPSEYAKLLELREGGSITVEVRDGSLVIKPLRD